MQPLDDWLLTDYLPRGERWDEAGLWRSLLAMLQDHCEADSCQLYGVDSGAWTLRAAQSGTGSLVCDDALLSELADREAPMARSDWIGLPSRTDLGMEVVVVHKPRRAVAIEDLESWQTGLARLRADWTVRRVATLWRSLFRPLATMQMARDRWSEAAKRRMPDPGPELFAVAFEQLAGGLREHFGASLAQVYLRDPQQKGRAGHTPDSQRALRAPNLVPILERAVTDIDRSELGLLWHWLDEGEVRYWTVAEDAQRDAENAAGGPPAHSFLASALRTPDGETIGLLLLAKAAPFGYHVSDAAAAKRVAEFLSDPLQLYRKHLLTRRGTTRGGWRDDPPSRATQTPLIGDSPAMQTLRRRVERVALSDLTTLVLGENGTDKEVVSQWIHAQSRRAEGPFVAVNCAALTESLLEAELFGHEKGAFTDAHESRAGKLEAASGGTLFLDEIGELTPLAQAKLLRVLEERSVVRVGGTESVPIDTRLIAATNRDLAGMVRSGLFREDLFFRLNVVTIDIPPLRDRAEDIGPLVAHFLKELAKRTGQPPPAFTPDATAALQAHPWPGNVRELRNVIERIAFLFPGETVSAPALGLPRESREWSFSVNSELPLAEATRQFQSAYIEQHIKSAAGNMSFAADRLGLHRTNLYRKLRQIQK